MKMQTKKNSDKSGGILVMVVVIMFTITIMIIGLFKLQQTAGGETVYTKQAEQAFWLAEAGVQDAVQRLNWQVAYRNNPTNFTTTVGKGTYQVSVVATPDIFATLPTTNYTIDVVGEVRGMKRRIQQVVSAVPGSKFTITSVGGTSSFNSNSDIFDGSIAVFNGRIDTGNNSTVNLGEHLFVDSDVTVSGRGDYNLTALPEGLQEPSFDPSSYQAAYGAVVARGTASANYSVPDTSISGTLDYTSTNVAFASGLSVASGTFIKSYGDVIFARNTRFNGPITIEAGGNVDFGRGNSLPDNVIIIAGGTVRIHGGTSVGNDVEITAGDDVSFGNQMTFNSRATIYAEDELSVASGGSSSQVTGDGIAFLANNLIELNSNFDPFRGIIYSNGSIDFNSNMDIYGTVVGQLGFDAASNVDFYYDPSAYTWALTGSGIGISSYDVILTRGKWQELKPL